MTNLNQKQRKAVNATDPNLVIVAPAGSGKTTTLVSAVKKYKDENPSASVTVITFTRKAAEDLRSKLQSYRGITASTIHSWAYQELERLANIINREDSNRGFKVKLLQEDKIKEILQDICKNNRYFYVKMWELYGYIILGNYNMDVSDAMKNIFERVKIQYIAYKQRMGLYDFTDLPQYLLDKLLDYNKTIDGIDALFVDEFQDVDDTQLEIFNLVQAKKKFFIGDSAQSIYIFRGATEEVMNKLDGFTIYDLDVNYRSNQEIIDFATTYRKIAMTYGDSFTSVFEAYRSDIKCENGPGGTVYVLNGLGHAYKINDMKRLNGEEIVRLMIKRNPMILCRKNKEVKAIQELGYQNVQTVHQAKGLEYDSVIVTGFEIQGLEDINIAYVAMTRAETHLLAADYDAFIKILKKVIKERPSVQDLF